MAILKIICLGFGLAFNDLIDCLILYLGVRQHSFCNVFIYMLLVTMAVFSLAFSGAYALQAGIPLGEAMSATSDVGTDGFKIGFSVFLLVFYVAAIALAFLGYREFKGSMQDAQGGGVMRANPFAYGSLKGAD